MPVYIYGDDSKIGRRKVGPEIGQNISLDIDREKLAEIMDEADHLAEVLRLELISMKQQHKQAAQPGRDIYHKLSAIYKAIQAADDTINRLTVDE